MCSMVFITAEENKMSIKPSRLGKTKHMEGEQTNKVFSSYNCFYVLLKKLLQRMNCFYFA